VHYKRFEVLETSIVQFQQQSGHRRRHQSNARPRGTLVADVSARSGTRLATSINLTAEHDADRVIERKGQIPEHTRTRSNALMLLMAYANCRDPTMFRTRSLLLNVWYKAAASKLFGPPVNSVGLSHS
jgi:hypothetical protein